MDRQMLKAQLSDCFINGLSIDEVLIKYPLANKDLYQEISEEIANKLNITAKILSPKTYYKGLGIVVENAGDGLNVTSIYKDCPGMKLGIIKNDKIIAVNYESLNGLNIESAIDKLRNSELENGTIMNVIRDGKLITLGYGLNIKPQVIDNIRKYPLNFTALLIGSRLQLNLNRDKSPDNSFSKNLTSKELHNFRT